MRYEDTSSHALRLRLYNSSVERSRFAVFARGHAIRRDVQIDAAVIGSSHWMEVRAPSFAITEMLACQRAPGGRAFAVWRPGEAAIKHELKGGARYRFEAEVVSMEEAEGRLTALRELLDLARMVQSEVGLAFEFPTLETGPCGAETLVWAAVTEEGVTARTSHSYPSEGVVVLSRTDIRLASAACRSLPREFAASV